MGDVITLTDKSREMKVVGEALEYTARRGRKSWIEFNEEDKSARFLQVPSREDLDDINIREQLIVELYSK